MWLEWTLDMVRAKCLVNFLCLGFGFFRLLAESLWWVGFAISTCWFLFQLYIYNIVQLWASSNISTYWVFFQLCIMVARNPYSTKSSLWWRFYILFCIAFEVTAFCWLCTALILYSCIKWYTCWFWLFFVCILTWVWV
jgi:hypothetical protein